jgi:hypothetical protein
MGQSVPYATYVHCDDHRAGLGCPPVHQAVDPADDGPERPRHVRHKEHGRTLTQAVGLVQPEERARVPDPVDPVDERLRERERSPRVLVLIKRAEHDYQAAK